jgi:hypothetical protein
MAAGKKCHVSSVRCHVVISHYRWRVPPLLCSPAPLLKVARFEHAPQPGQVAGRVGQLLEDLEEA